MKMDSKTMKEHMEFHDKICDLVEPMLRDIDQNYDMLMVSLISCTASVLLEKNSHDEALLRKQLNRTLGSLTDVTAILYKAMEQQEQEEDKDDMGDAHPTVQ